MINDFRETITNLHEKAKANKDRTYSATVQTDGKTYTITAIKSRLPWRKIKIKIFEEKDLDQRQMTGLSLDTITQINSSRTFEFNKGQDLDIKIKLAALQLEHPELNGLDLEANSQILGTKNFNILISFASKLPLEKREALADVIAPKMTENEINDAKTAARKKCKPFETNLPTRLQRRQDLIAGKKDASLQDCFDVYVNSKNPNFKQELETLQKEIQNWKISKTKPSLSDLISLATSFARLQTDLKFATQCFQSSGLDHDGTRSSRLPTLQTMGRIGQEIIIKGSIKSRIGHQLWELLTTKGHLPTDAKNPAVDKLTVQDIRERKDIARLYFDDGQPTNNVDPETRNILQAFDDLYKLLKLQTTTENQH